MNIGILGAGVMGSSMLHAFVAKNKALPQEVFIVEPRAELREVFEKDGFKAAASPDDSLKAVEIMLLAVKPQVALNACRALAPHLSNSCIVVSIMAGVQMVHLSAWFPNTSKIVRTMPNLPAQVGCGVMGCFYGTGLNPVEKKLVEDLLSVTGTCVPVLEESLLDAITAISGSGPAYVYYFMEKLAEAGQTLGLGAEQSMDLVTKTFEGALALLRRGQSSPRELRQAVTSPGGTTAAAIAEFDKHNLGTILTNGVKSAKDRACAMADSLFQPPKPLS